MSTQAPRSAPDAAADVAARDLLLDGRLRIEDLVDREGLDELCRSFQTLFGIPVRIYSTDGALLADAAGEQELCAYVNSTPAGRKACASVVGAVRARDPVEGSDGVHPCFTGAIYRVLPIDYDGRHVGRLIVGPFVPGRVADPPASLVLVDPSIERDRAKALLVKMPHAKAETVTRIAAHLRAALDLILFSGHKAHVTSTMHLASVRESFRQLEEKTARLQEAFDRLKELDRLKSNFLATVSHELRTPLTSIIGYSEMLAEGLAGELAPEQREYVKTIHGKGEQLLSLIMGLLDLSKLESGTMRVDMRPVRIEAVLREVVSTLAPAARRKGVALAVEAAPDLAHVRGDPERLRQVFLNLVENAIKFTPPEGSIGLRARMVDPDSSGDAEGLSLMAPTRARVEVRVIDTGIGIPPRERTRVFDPFYQVDSSSTREYGGTGLGLSIVKRLVSAHSGSIRIEDTTPAGTTFVVQLLQAADAGEGPGG
jgi:signal transduction histidine kinase